MATVSKLFSKIGLHDALCPSCQGLACLNADDFSQMSLRVFPGSGLRFRFARNLSIVGSRIVEIDELKDLIAQLPGSHLQLFDVRDPSSYADGHIPTAANIPRL